MRLTWEQIGQHPCTVEARGERKRYIAMATSAGWRVTKYAFDGRLLRSHLALNLVGAQARAQSWEDDGASAEVL